MNILYSYWVRKRMRCDDDDGWWVPPPTPLAACSLWLWSKNFEGSQHVHETLNPIKISLLFMKRCIAMSLAFLLFCIMYVYIYFFLPFLLWNEQSYYIFLLLLLRKFFYIPFFLKKNRNEKKKKSTKWKITKRYDEKEIYLQS